MDPNKLNNDNKLTGKLTTNENPIDPNEFHLSQFVESQEEEYSTNDEFYGTNNYLMDSQRKPTGNLPNLSNPYSNNNNSNTSNFVSAASLIGNPSNYTGSAVTFHKFRQHQTINKDVTEPLMALRKNLFNNQAPNISINIQTNTPANHQSTDPNEHNTHGDNNDRNFDALMDNVGKPPSLNPNASDTVTLLSRKNRLQTPFGSSKKCILPPALEPLRPTIMSQHNVLEEHIKELGNICLNFTIITQKKKESSTKLINNEIIPRSLRIKCELSTTPSYTGHPQYIHLKQKLQSEVESFITNSTAIMKEWSVINLNLLLQDRCNNILTKAITILEGLTSYYLDLLNPTQWTSLCPNHIPLLLMKIYFSGNFIPDITKIIEYFEIPQTDILKLTSKIITKQSRDDLALQALESIDLSQIQTFDESQTLFITETLDNFHIILMACTTDLWTHHLQKTRIKEASLKFKNKMEASRMNSATASTAKAIERATEKFQNQKNEDAITQLRLENLEKLLQHQQQTSKEILSHIQNNNSKQKNLKGSYHGSVASPPHPFGPPQTEIVDLSFSPQPYKRQRVQWGHQPHIQQYNPLQTPIQSFSHSNTLMPPQQPPNNLQPNPFILHQPKPPHNTDVKHRGGRVRGRKRGT